MTTTKSVFQRFWHQVIALFGGHNQKNEQEGTTPPLEWPEEPVATVLHWMQQPGLSQPAADFVVQLADQFAGQSPEAIDAWVSLAKRHLAEVRELARRADIRAELKRQVGRLLERGYPGLAGETQEEFLSTLSPAVELAYEGTSTNGNIPFVLAFPHHIVTDRLQMAGVVYAGKSGATRLDVAQIYSTSNGHLPHGPYLILDVDPGRVVDDVSGYEEEVAAIKRRGRSVLAVVEVIALATHCDSLLNVAPPLRAAHSLHVRRVEVEGSSVVKETDCCTPSVCLDGDEHAQLVCSRDQVGSIRIPSCASRVEILKRE